jgi:hypothetical protein
MDIQIGDQMFLRARHDRQSRHTAEERNEPAPF